LQVLKFTGSDYFTVNTTLSSNVTVSDKLRQSATVFAVISGDETFLRNFQRAIAPFNEYFGEVPITSRLPLNYATQNMIIVTLQASCSSNPAVLPITRSMSGTIRVNGITIITSTNQFAGACSSIGPTFTLGAGFAPSESGARLLAEVAVFDSVIPLDVVEMAEMLLASKWGLRPYLAPIKPPTLSAKNAEIVFRINSASDYTAEIKLPTMGTAFYSIDNFRSRICMCSSGTITSSQSCVEQKKCTDIPFGQSSMTLSGLKSRDQIRFVMQAQTGILAHGDVWQHIDRPPYQNCINLDSCFVTGDLSLPTTTDGFPVIH